MATTYTWIGASSTNPNDPTNWNPPGPPGPGDIAVILGTSGSPFLVTGTGSSFQLSGNTINMGYATFQLPNGASMDSTTTFTNVDAGVIPVGAPAEIDTFGHFDNFGGAIAAGGAGGSMILDIQQDPGPPVVTGSFVNDGVISATSGATLTIQTGTNAYFYNDATVLADGGTVDITATLARANGLYELARSGAMEFNTSVGSDAFVLFGDGTDKLTIDQALNFSGRILNFQAGDKIDLPGVVADQAVYGSGTLTLSSSGVTTATLVLASGVYSSGTFTIPALTPGGGSVTPPGSSFGFARNASGDLIVSTAKHSTSWTGAVDGNWATAPDPTGNWSTNSGATSTAAIPGTNDTAVFETGTSTPYTVNTGASAQSVGSLVLADPQLTLIVNGSLSSRRNIFDSDGTVSVTSGGTLTGPAFRQITGTTDLEIAAGGAMVLTGSASSSLSAGQFALDVVGIAEVAGGTLDAGGDGTAGDTGGRIIIGDSGSKSPTDMAATAGATVRATYTVVAAGPTSAGNLVIGGVGTTWLDGGDPTDANARGYMVIGENNSSPSVDALTAASLSVTGGASLTEANYAIIGYNADAAATISGGAHWTVGSGVTASLVLGGSSSAAAGGIGTLTETTGGDIRVSGNLYLWSGSSVTIDALSHFEVGDLNIGGLGNVSVVSGHKISGAGLINGSVLNAGKVEAAVAGQTLEINGQVSGSGTMQIDNAATLRLDQLPITSQTIDFAGLGTETLILGIPGSDYSGPISGLGYGDRIEMGNGLSFNDAHGSGSNITIDLAGGGTYQLTNVGYASGVSPTFLTGFDATNNAAFVEITCFAAGTRILAADGEVAVQDLRPGDLVVTIDRGVRWLKPIRWIGRRRVDLRRHSRPECAHPIRIHRGAFAENVPHRDLLVSPEHCVFVDGALIPARLLVNGGSIVQDTLFSAIEYFHVELDRHGVLLSEGLTTESYLDTGNRMLFETTECPQTLHPQFAVNAGHARWRTDACAPLAVDPALVQPVWTRLRARCETLGLVVTETPTTTESDLCLEVGGRRLRAAFVGDGRHMFVLDGTAGPARLLSRAACPADARPWLDDRRRLGVLVRRIVLDDGFERVEIPVDHPALARGWWKPEQAGNRLVRWTDGTAAIPLRAGACILEVHLEGEMRYPLTQRRTADARDAA